MADLKNGDPARPEISGATNSGTTDSSPQTPPKRPAQASGQPASERES